MKALLLLSLTSALLILTGCDSKKESISQDCTHNGVKVDCNELRSREPEQKKEKVPLKLSVAGSGKYEIKNGVLKILSGFSKEEVKKIDNDTYSCQVALPVNFKMEIEANEHELMLTHDNVLNAFERQQDSGIDFENLMIGKFYRFDKVDNTESFIELTENGTIKLNLVCYFNQ